MVTTVGTLDNPLGTGDPLDVSISPNPDPAVSANYPSYGYIGGGPVYQVPAGMPGAGNLLVTYHAELPIDALYAALGLAASSDNGLHWTDLGEIIRLNQAYALGLDGFEIGDGPLVLSPDGKYFYLYFPDWLANGTLHATTTTHVSVARALVSSVLQAAFGPNPHAVPFQKFYEGNWHLQPAIGGASTDLIPGSSLSGYLDIHFNSALQRYSMIISDDTTFAYAESLDALNWTLPTSLGNFETDRRISHRSRPRRRPAYSGKNFLRLLHSPADRWLRLGGRLVAAANAGLPIGLGRSAPSNRTH